MKSFKDLNFKQKLIYCGKRMLYPLILLYYFLGKCIKLFSVGKRQITASILTVCLTLYMIPVLSITAFAAGVLNNTMSVSQLANNLTDGSISLTDISGYGDVSYVTGAKSVLGIEEGIVLDTAGEAFIGKSQADSDLKNLIVSEGKTVEGTGDMSVLQFNMVATANQLRFNYVYASSEFNQSSKYNDIFGLFVSVNGGPFENIAKLDNGKEITLTNIRAGKNGTQLNNGNSTNIGNEGKQYDYFTVTSIYNLFTDSKYKSDETINGVSNVFTAKKNVTVGDTITLKLAISDVGDMIYNSYVIIEAESLCFINADIDYTDEKLIELEPDSTYKITVNKNEYIINSDNDGTVPLIGNDNDDKPYNLLGQTVKMVKINSSGIPVSDEKELTITARPEVEAPEAPDKTEYEKPSEVSKRELHLEGENLVITPKENQVYSIDGGETWLTADADGKIRVYLGTDLEDSVSIVTKILATENAPESLLSDSVTIIRKELLKSFDDISAPDVEITYDGENHTPEVTTAVEDIEILYSLAEQEAYASSISLKNAGTYTVYYRVTHDGYYPYYDAFQYKINPILLERDDFSVNLNGLMYNGSQIKPEVSSVNVLVTSNDYDVTYQNNINVGTNTAKIIITGKNNATGTVEIPFTISQYHTHTDNSVYKNEFTSESGEIADGYYYLPDNIIATGNYTIPEGANVTLCLNGKTLDLSDGYITNNGTLTICDCKNSGKITSECYDTYYATNNARFGTIINNGTLNLSSGKIEATDDYGNGILNSSGKVNVIGGQICAGYVGIYNKAGTVDISGGKVIADSVNSTSCAVNNVNDGILNVSGNAELMGYSEGSHNGYGIINRATVYLSGSPTISDNNTGDGDICIFGGNVYAHAKDSTGNAYNGNEISVKIPTSFTDGVVVYEINDDNEKKFALTYGSDLTLLRLGDDLIVDSTAPTGEISIGTNHWNEFLNTITFGLFFKETQSVTITADDNLSGVKEIAYYLATGEMSKAQLDALQSTDWTVDDEFNINPENKYIIYAKITDNAGNVTYLSTNGIVVFKDTEITTGEYEYTLTTKTDIVTNIKPGNNTVNMIDICEPGGNAGDMLDYYINDDGYIVLKGESLENFTKDWYAGDYTVTVMYNALGETYVDGTSKGDKINDTVLALTVKRFKVEKPAADSTVFTYNGSEQTYTVAESEYYTVSGNKRTNAGEQDVTVALKDTNTFEWSDGTTDNLTFKFNIDKASFTADVEQNGELTYDGTEQMAGVITTENGVKGGQTVSYKYGLSENDCNSSTVPTFKYADNYTVYFVATANNHNDAKGSFKVIFNKKALTVTANNNTITYGDAPSNNGVEYSGFVLSETHEVLNGTLGFDYSYAQYDDIGDNYTITPKGLSAANYEITFVPGKLTVKPLMIEFDWNTLSPEDLVYDGSDKKIGTTVTNKVTSGQYDLWLLVEYHGDTKNVTEEGFYAQIKGPGGEKAHNYNVDDTAKSPVYRITKATPETNFPTGFNIDTDKKLSDIDLTGFDGYTWDAPDTAVKYDVHEYSMTFTPADTQNYKTVSKMIKVTGGDITAPTGEISLKENKWTEFLNSITFGLFFKETQEISITAADTESGVKEIAYYLATEELSKDDVKALESSKWTAYADAFKVEPDNKYVVYARITDNAGNVVYINSDGIVLDSIKPVISGIENGKDTYGDAVFTVDEENLDTVTLDGEPIEVKEGKYSVPADNKEHTIAATDKTGNTVTYKLTVYRNYKVSFVVDGKETALSEVGHGKNAVLPEIPQKSGYTAKWDKDGKNITADTVITAVYEKIDASIKSPQTGESINLNPWLAVLFIGSAAAIGYSFFYKEKKKRTV